MFDRTSTQGRWLQSQHAHNERPRHRSQWFGYHVDRTAPPAAMLGSGAIAPQYDGLFQSELDLQADMFLEAHSVPDLDDDWYSDIGGEA